ncbi:NADH dehydrogenase [ubiquinone] 1 alpha subcomplex subunit 6 [Diorhabda carinulata]|uniref:NADH dehydrogenase [ubiquinone] 1 alpha subcomplex subunit 6 n=1 Tax=Diorhabda sublineata TaxID=1163346 RepID=UPI0024E08AC8|nr:NADH dehydrogenase [ubiquinone] 1 alpha subcomplex subunit 6 [Diorhabda sublineata]XP_057668634.1 NADH dehydrogenase [ubiquinone] 1 alpha subcomplex subunit 6 [Diorhabda carinulata]
MASQAVRKSIKEVKPILSLNREEARKRVLNLYKAWYRQLPYIVKNYDIPRTVEQCKTKLREEFTKFDEIKDVRLIDMLVIKGQMELKEVVNVWKQKSHIMAYFKDTIEPKPKDFLSKFLNGKE